MLTKLVHPLPSVSPFVFLAAWMLSAACLPALSIAEEKPEAVGSRPNIIFILADDLGYGDLSCFGQANFSTPHLDAMAEQGIKLTSHYAGSTVCAPSRACLLTGKHTGHVYQRFNGEVQFREDPHDLTVARILSQAGYQTAMIGKSGLSCNSKDGGLPNRKGFDHFFGYVSHRAAHRYYPESLWMNGKLIEYPGNHGKHGEHYSGDLFLAETMIFLQQHADKPFFLHLSLQQPHADLAAPDEWKAPFLNKFEDQPTTDGYYRGELHPKATYAAMVTYLDDTVGKVRAKLRQLGVEQNTLIVFSSDNGPMSEGGWNAKNFASSGPLRGGKRDLYEGGIRIPTIACWPNTIQPGSQSNHPSAFWDFLPTACELAGADPPEDIDGISYLPTLLGKQQQQEHEYLYWEFYEMGGRQALRRGNWKAIRLNVHANPTGPLELYDLSKDLGEKANVADQHPEIVAQLAALMVDAHEDSPIISFGNKPNRAAP